MTKKFRTAISWLRSDNPKSTIQKRPCRPKSVALLALVVSIRAVLGCGSRAAAWRKSFASVSSIHSTASGSAVLVEAFGQELTKLGWIEGKNISIEYRYGENKGSERLLELAAELVRLKVDLIVVSATGPTLAAKSATTTIPIVMTRVGDPVGEGLVASLARPGGNVTGLSTLATELNTKRLEILKDAIPKLARVGFLRGPGRRHRRHINRSPTEKAQGCGCGAEARIGGD